MGCLEAVGPAVSRRNKGACRELKSVGDECDAGFSAEHDRSAECNGKNVGLEKFIQDVAKANQRSNSPSGHIRCSP